MRETSIHGGIGKINRAANVVHTIGIAKPGKSAEKGTRAIFYTPSFELKIKCCVDQLNPPPN
jgi:hypothetical protein